MRWDRASRSLGGILRVLRYGIPVALHLGLEMGAFGATTFLAGMLGVQATVAHGVVINLASMSFMVPLGIGLAATTRIGNLIGERRYSDAQSSAQLALALSAVTMAALGVGLFLGRERLPAMYIPDDPGALALAAAILPIAAAFQIVDGLQVVGSGILRGMGRTIPPAVFNFVAWWVLTKACAAESCGAGWLGSFCDFALQHPVAMVNALFFINVCVIFWIISLVQRSTWLIDPYWTIIPILIAHFYATHPLAEADPIRSELVLAIVWIWGVRLTVNYFRRERWRFGVREDWRYADMRRKQSHFWLSSLVSVYLVQQLMLVGLTLPLWAIHAHDDPFTWPDVVFAAAALAGILIARAADRQLYAFMKENRAREAVGRPRIEVLDTGIWRYSRHPNYFGEQLFWWALAGWGMWLGEPWVVVGTAFNSVILAVVTVMTERRIMSRVRRREAYGAYQQRTSVWIPWPPTRSDT